MPRPYPKEFREGAVRLARQGDRSIKDIAKELGSSSRVCAVVSYEQRPARIITTVANRKDPKQWTP